MKILFVCPYPPGKAPSQRFRFEQYFSDLDRLKFVYHIAPFMSEATWEILYTQNISSKKVAALVRGYFARFANLLTLHRYDIIFIHREATPVGPPIFEWFAAHVLKRKIIYDFDDAIWLDDPNEKGTLLSKLKWKSKVRSICKWSYKISCGNEYLASYARQFSNNVVVNPTTIDTKEAHNPSLHSKKTQKKLTIGWTGTHSTLKYLDIIVPVIQELEMDYEFKFLVISNKKPNFALTSLQFRYWNKTTEVTDLLEIDIGVMPLSDDSWSKGKCGFKALQFMALEIPAIVSPVGVNIEVVDHGINGFICQSDKDWATSIIKLLTDDVMRKEMGKSARQKVEKNYSITSNCSNFLLLFE